jgi:hypothetical protein
MRVPVSWHPSTQVHPPLQSSQRPAARPSAERALRSRRGRAIPIPRPPPASQARVAWRPLPHPDGPAPGLRRASADLEMQPLTLWLTHGLPERVAGALAAPGAGGGAPGSPTSAANLQQQQQRHRQRQQQQGGEQKAAPQQQGQQGGAQPPSPPQGLAGLLGAADELAASVSIANVCCVALLSAAPTAAGAPWRRMYAVLDVAAATPPGGSSVGGGGGHSGGSSFLYGGHWGSSGGAAGGQRPSSARGAGGPHTRPAPLVRVHSRRAGCGDAAALALERPLGPAACHAAARRAHQQHGRSLHHGPHRGGGPPHQRRQQQQQEQLFGHNQLDRDSDGAEAKQLVVELCASHLRLFLITGGAHGSGGGGGAACAAAAGADAPGAGRHAGFCLASGR